MKWEEHVMKTPPQEYFQNRKQTDIECPICGKKLWKRMDIILTTYPEKYQYECDCGWVGYAFN